MAYRVGTIAVTAGSATVTGSGTAWVSGVRKGWVLQLLSAGGDLTDYEIASVNSNTSITLERTYTGTTGTGRAYQIKPTGGLYSRLTDAVQALTDRLNDAADKVLVGIFGAGSLAAPGIRFDGDLDTGIMRAGSNIMDLVTGGVRKLRIGATGIMFGDGTVDGGGAVPIVGTTALERAVITVPGGFADAASTVGFQVGTDGGLNIAADGNDIQARNGGSASGLNLNRFGGDVGIGATESTITLRGDTNAPRLRLNAGNGVSLTSLTHGFQIGSDASGNLRMDTNEVQALVNGAVSDLYLNRSGGSVIVGTENVGRLHNSGYTTFERDGDLVANISRRGTAGSLLRFQVYGDTVGTISGTSTSTTYSTSSDYRLKTNITPIDDAWNRVAALPVVEFAFKADPDHRVVGFIAHELAEHFPSAVTGRKDEVDADGPVYQGVDHSKLVPLLIAALQQVMARVAALEAPAVP